MIRSTRRGGLPRRILIVAAAALAPAIAGCEAGNNAPTLQWHQPTDGTLQHVGKNITIANAFVLGAPVGAALQQGQNAGLFLGLVNTGKPPNRLLTIKAPGIAQTVQFPIGGIALRPQSRVLLSGPQPTLILQHLSRPLTSGSVIKIYLVFAKAGAIRLSVPVLPMVSDYSTFSPAPSASPSASPSTNSTPGFSTPSPSPSSSR